MTSLMLAPLGGRNCLKAGGSRHNLPGDPEFWTFPKLVGSPRSDTAHESAHLVLEILAPQAGNNRPQLKGS